LSWDREITTGQVGRDEILLSVKKTGEGIVYETAFPWESLSMEPPEAGRRIGFALTLNDRDSGEKNWQGMEWFGGIFYGSDSEKYGQIILVE